MKQKAHSSMCAITAPTHSLWLHFTGFLNNSGLKIQTFPTLCLLEPPACEMTQWSVKAKLLDILHTNNQIKSRQQQRQKQKNMQHTRLIHMQLYNSIRGRSPARSICSLSSCGGCLRCCLSHPPAHQDDCSGSTWTSSGGRGQD